MHRTAIVVYQLFYKMALGQSFSWGAIVEFLAKVSLGAYVDFSLSFFPSEQCISSFSSKGTWKVIQDVSFFSLSSVAMGVAFGIASVLWLGFIFNNTVIEITLTLAVSYIAFFTVSVTYV